MKVLPLEAAKDPAFTERFNREAQALARLSHPGIIPVFDFGQAGPYYYFLMEYVDGLNLRQLVQSKPLAPAEALAIVPKICEALQYAHDEGVVHRDIKPANILIDKKGRVKIADFGLAKLLGKAPADYTLTATAQVIGTPHYMAPEQMTGSHAVDHRADIYSLGVVFYEMLTGELPVGRFDLPSQKVHVDVRLDEVVLRTLEREPERRYQQADHVKTDVESISGTGIASQKTADSSPPLAVTPPATEASGEADAGPPDRTTVNGPGISLIVTGALNLVGGIFMALFLLQLAPPGSPSEATGATGAGPVWLLGLLALAVITMVGSTLIVAGGLKMIRLKSYGFAVTASVLAMILTPGNIVGLPIGIWALVTLLRPEVKAAFQRQADARKQAVEAARRAELEARPVAPQFVLGIVQKLHSRATGFQLKVVKAILLIVAVLGVWAFITTSFSGGGGRARWEVGEPSPWLEVHFERGVGSGYAVKPSWAWLLLIIAYSATYLYGLIRREEGEPRAFRAGSWLIGAAIAVPLIIGMIGLILAAFSRDPVATREEPTAANEQANGEVAPAETSTRE